jgi:hypothetical protein
VESHARDHNVSTAAAFACETTLASWCGAVDLALLPSVGKEQRARSLFG